MIRVNANGTVPSGEAGVHRVDAKRETPRVEPRERILSTAYELFARRGIQNVGVDELIRRSGVAKATFYHHFPSKEALGLAFLERHDAHWTTEFTRSEAVKACTTPTEQLLAVFEVFDNWLRRDDFQAGSFIKVLLEMGPNHPLGQASIQYLAKTRTMVETLAERADLREPADFASSFHLLLKGALVSATEGDLQAPQRAKRMAAALIADHQK